MIAFWRPRLLCLSAALAVLAGHPAHAFDTRVLGTGQAPETAAPDVPAPHVLTPRRSRAGPVTPTAADACAAYRQPTNGPKVRRAAQSAAPACTEHAKGNPAAVAPPNELPPASDVASSTTEVVK